MVYISIDTCVWVVLLKCEFNTENNLFDEICYWIESKDLIHITPENVLREWNRHKIKRSKDAVDHFKKIQQETINFYGHNSELTSTFQPDVIERKLIERVDRIDKILTTLSKIAPESSAILEAAGRRSLDCLSPNNPHDSYRDTVNILSLLEYLKTNSINGAIFTTQNYQDFSNGNDKHSIHKDLEQEFKAVQLEYVFTDVNAHFGQKLFSILRGKGLPNYINYLKEKEKEEQEEKLKQTAAIPEQKIENPDKDFLENIKVIDLIISNPCPTTYQAQMLKGLINSHDSYKQYFLRHVGS